MAFGQTGSKSSTANTGVPLDFSLQGSGTQNAQDFLALENVGQILWSDDGTGTVDDAVAIRVDDMLSATRNIVRVADAAALVSLANNWEAVHAGNKAYQMDTKTYHDWDGFFFVQAPQVSQYSTNEQSTGTKWVDGKEIYQITVTGTNLVNQQQLLPTGIVEVLLDTTSAGYGKNASGSVIPTGYRDGANSINAFQQNDGSILSLLAGVFGVEYAITLRYTKL